MADANTGERAATPAQGTLGRYQLLQEIASGGMATVYLARAAGIGGFERIVAIKCCHPHLRKDEQFAAMFLDEARLAARIHHPNVVPTLDVGEGTSLYFVMEYVEGVSLAELSKAAPEPLPPAIALRVMVDVLAGLHAAHELRDGAGQPMNLVHRDVSPQNVLIGTDGVARIVDFGVAKASARATVTRGGEIKGKLGYMPPEQFLGQPVGRQADIYAAGVVLWEALAGRRLFTGDSDAAVMNLVLRGKVPSLIELRPEVPATVAAAIEQALDRRAEQRHATAAAFAEALETAGAPLASARDVAALVQTRFAGWLRERRAFLNDTRTRPGAAVAPGTVHVAPAPTLVQRLLDGSVLLIPRRVALWGAGAVALAAAAATVAVWPRAAPPVTVTVPPSLVAPVVTAPPAPPAPLAAADAPAETTEPRARPKKTTAPARAKRVVRPAARATTPPRAARRPGEFRPEEL